MKVKVKETQEIINVEFAHTVNYGGQIEKIWQDSFSGKLYPASLLEQIIEEKMVSLDKVCKWLRANIDLYADTRRSLFSNYQEVYLTDNFETKFRKAMEE